MGKRWRAKIGDIRHPERHTGSYYYGLLKPVCTRVDVWRTTYFHELSGGISDVVEWFKSTALRPYLAQLNEEEQAAFLDAYSSAVAQAYTTYVDGTVLLPFPRLFIVATR